MENDNDASFFDRTNKWIKNSVTLKLIIIGILLLLMLIPIGMVEDLIRERKYRQEEAIAEISDKWGLSQTIKGPVLTVPYVIYTKVYDKKLEEYKYVKTKKYAHFLPESLNIIGGIDPKKRKRGVYEAVVYSSSIVLDGLFEKPDFSDWKIEKENILFDESFLSFGMSDLRGIQENVSLEWNTSTYNFNPGVENNSIIYSGLSTKVNLDSANQFSFKMKLVFNGSSNLNFIPLGKQTDVTITSKWPDPKFDGAFLPDNHEITKDGFNATWRVLNLNRPYPQKFRDAITGVDESAFGVNLFMPVDQYKKSTRTAKYAVLFISLTFLIFFFIQVINKVRIHPIQYILVGLALCTFYTLLISFSEHIDFNWAYLLASVGVVGMITGYAKSMFKNNRLTLFTGGIVIVLYTFIFTIIQMQDYALLFGSIGLFLVLALVMYLSRKVNWYALSEHKSGD